MSESGLRAALAKMESAGVPATTMQVFSGYYAQLEQGATGVIPESSIEPVRDLPRLEELEVDPAVVQDAFARTAVIKLNGGLGTSMGMDRAKSLLPVKGGLTFLDVMAEQVLALRRRHGVRLPLVFMNSFRTRDDSLAALSRYPDLAAEGIPVDFVQTKVPKLLEADLTPVEWPDDPAMEWCPPGHGDVYPSLLQSGVLDALLAQGFRWGFLSNSDNLGAVADPRIAGWLQAESVPFLLEACWRTPADVKGGHLALRKEDGQLVLREAAQTAPEDRAALADLDRHAYMNSNNLWIDLEVLRERLGASGGDLGLSLIRNVKPVDPAQTSTPKVIQVESAMGSALQAFPGARAIVVDRSRFVPVKTTNDLLVLRSDVYELGEDHLLQKAAVRQGRTDPYVDLDAEHYRRLGDFDRRFPAGPPSLVEAERLVVRGDVVFGADVKVVGEVEVRDVGAVPDGAVLTG